MLRWTSSIILLIILLQPTRKTYTYLYIYYFIEDSTLYNNFIKKFILFRFKFYCIWVGQLPHMRESKNRLHRIIYYCYVIYNIVLHLELKNYRYIIIIQVCLYILKCMLCVGFRFQGFYDKGTCLTVSVFFFDLDSYTYLQQFKQNLYLYLRIILDLELKYILRLFCQL